MSAPRPYPLRALRDAASPQFIRYAIAGATGTAVHFVVLIALVQAASLAAVPASTAGAIAGALVNYRLNHRYTFESDRSHARALPRFALVALAGIAINAAVVAAMIAFVSPNYLLAQIAATAVVLVSGFLVNRAWTF